MTRTLVSVSMCAVLIVLLAVVQEDSVEQQIGQLRQGLANLGLRVSQLEHAGGAPQTVSTDTNPGAPSSAGLGAAASASGRSMTVASISQSHHTDDNSRQIDQLKRQTGALWNTVNTLDDQTVQDAGQQIYAGGAAGGARGWDGAVGGGIVTTNAGSVGRQVAGDVQMRNRYLTQYDIKNQQLDSLQQAATQPKQIILGHDSDKVITLQTTDNLSRALESINIGDVVTWTGHRDSVSDGGETWTILTITKAGQ